VTVAEPDTEEEFAFTARLEDRLGRVQTPRYDLSFRLTTSEVDLAIDDSNNITRFNVEGRLVWSLSEGDVVLISGEETAFTAYSATGSTISTLESERDARRRLMVILADKVVARLLAS
jgi:LPS-assembly lipoprotein